MTEAMYCTVEQVKAAASVTAPSYVDSQIAREIATASAIIDGDMRRPLGAFWPVTDTRYFDWLDHQYSLTWRLWLDGNTLGAAPTQVLSNGVDITSGVLARNGVGDSVPPFDYLEANLATDATFNAGASYQRAISVTGLFIGCIPAEADSGAITGLASPSTTTTFVSNGALVGVGSVIRAESERMVVTGKSFFGSFTLGSDLSASTSAQAVPLVGGAANAGEVLLIDAEQMLVMTTAGATAIVQRGYGGTAVATHTNTTNVYVNRSVTLLRGALGTTAASHGGVSITTHQVPSAVQTLAVAETLRLLGLERAGYTMVIERGNLTKISTADTLWAQVRGPYQRKLRLRTAARHL